MRKREKRLVAAFYTTHDAMAFEEFCIKRGAPGRLIPLPREISAGCGLAWSAPASQEEDQQGALEQMEKLLLEAGIRAQHLQMLEL